jgi:hypothetical protein
MHTHTVGHCTHSPAANVHSPQAEMYDLFYYGYILTMASQTIWL